MRGVKKLGTYAAQAMIVLALLSIIIIFQNQMVNDIDDNPIFNNASLISSGGSVGIINQTTVAQEGESVVQTIKNISSFDVNTTNVFLSTFFYLLILYEMIIIYFILHPVKGS